MSKTAQYILTAYSFINNITSEQILDVGYQSKSGNPIPSFDEKLLIDLCSESTEIFKSEPNVLNLHDDVIIVGDIHGSFHDLLRILKFIDENDKKVLFLGDYVDRGNFSLECITLLLSLKVSRPESFYLLRGNHEFDSVCSKYGFRDEILNHHNFLRVENNLNNKKLTKASSLVYNSEKVKKLDVEDDFYANHKLIHCYKYSEALYEAFIGTFAYLPIGCVVNDSTFCIHGGLSPRLKNIDDLNAIKRPVVNFDENQLLADVVWSDPTDDYSSIFDENPRGSGFLFSFDAVANFLNENSLKRLIRAHQCVSEGFFLQFDDRCITVFSASSYDNSLENKSAVLQLFQKDDRVQIVTFPPLSRLQKIETLYYKVQSLYSKDTRSNNCFSLLYPKLYLQPAVRMVTNYNGRRIANHKSEKIMTLPRSVNINALIRPRFSTKPLNKKLLVFSDDDKSIDIDEDHL